MKDKIREIEKKCKLLIDDSRTGLKLSSDTNKTRYAILTLLDEMYELGKQDTIKEIKKWAEEFKGCYADSQSLEYINKKILINHLNNLK